MADIDVVPKRKTNIWMWIILAIIVVAVLWFALGRSSTPQSGYLLDEGMVGQYAAVSVGNLPAVG